MNKSLSAPRGAFIPGLVIFLILDIGLSFAYGYLPITMTGVRGIISSIQFGTITITMAYVLRAIIEDF